MYKIAEKQYRNIKGVRYELFVFDTKGESQSKFDNTLQGAKDYAKELELQEFKIMKDSKWNIYSIYIKS